MHLQRWYCAKAILHMSAVYMIGVGNLCESMEWKGLQLMDLESADGFICKPGVELLFTMIIVAA